MCDEDEEDGVSRHLVRCSNINCQHKKWYHLGCVDLTKEPDTFEDWWCSDECRATKSSEFCVCKQAKDETTVMCSSGEFCEGGQKFHLSCIGLNAHPGKNSVN